MFMPKPNRVTIYKYLFVEGVMVIKKNRMRGETLLELAAIPNLHIIKAMESLKSKGCVKEKFVWSHYYWTLTEEGITFLRDFLHLPPHVVPKTLMRCPTRSGLLQRPNLGLKDGYAGNIDKPEYRGGFGRANPTGSRSLSKTKETSAVKDDDKLEYRRRNVHLNNQM